MWVKISIRSCDGGAFMGNREPISFRKHLLHFKGNLIIDEIFKYLQATRIITDKDEIVIAGSLNGAVAAMNYVDWLKQYTNSPIRILVDSGIHLNEFNRKTNNS
jgi:predicted TIM-barrel enzyme